MTKLVDQILTSTAELQRPIPVMQPAEVSHWQAQTTEHHYGALRGQNKDETRRLYGKAQVQQWRRSFYTVPPLLAPAELSNDRRYTKYGPAVEPRGESLKMAYDRIMPYWIDTIAPRLLDGQNQLIVAHGSTLRALIKYLEQISDTGIDGVEVANGVPIQYHLDDQLRVIGKDEL